MHRPIQLTNSTSSVRTSQLTRPNDNKAIKTRFPALIVAGLQPAFSILRSRCLFSVRGWC